eukprot:TRINITY_DN6899_c0_g1_i1.p1 TRINITY_DN6899_c0_g1~~TRINITY_DN6899_c0_g1_i1.p1  ORF type:complete len:312 (+),score=39.08 TRINITY_DN6899_c0_g1_i1:124-1059(+)
MCSLFARTTQTILGEEHYSLRQSSLSFGIRVLKLQHVRTYSSSLSNAARGVSSNKSRGGLPRFYVDTLPSSKDNIVHLEGDEFWHMSKVLRLRVHDRLELFNGRGGLVQGQILRIQKTGADIIAVEDPAILSPTGIQWHIFSAFGTLKGGRADWLIEKCTELGASSVTPLITERSVMLSENRLDRWQRVTLAASKQCQRVHQLILNTPIKLESLLPQIKTTSLAFLARAEETPLMKVLITAERRNDGILIVGPEGDFSEKEVKALIEFGAIPVGLGPNRLRVETATVAMLAATMLWTDLQHDDTCKEYELR